MNWIKILKWSVLIALLAYCGWITVWARGEASRHSCRAIEIVVDAPAPIDSVVKKGVADELRKYPGKIIGIPVNQVDTRSVERFLNRLNMFENVTCMVMADGDMRIRVTPMVPVMRVFAGNKSYYVNKDGKHISTNAEFFNDVPIVSGNFNKNFQPKDVWPLVRFINDDPMLSGITAMVLAQGPNDLLIVPRITGHIVNFGDTSRLSQKRDALRAFYHNIMPYKGWQHYDTISVKYRGQVVAARRDKSHLNVAELPFEEVDLEEATLPTVENAAPTQTQTDTIP